MAIKTNKNIKKDFPWFKKNPGWIYLDNAATSLKPKTMIETVVNFYEKWTANPHNTDSNFTYHISEMIQDTRKKIAKLINANVTEIIFTSGATESLNVIANGLKQWLKKDDEIILTNGEHTSNLLPWMQLAKEKQCKLVFAGELNQVPTENDIIQKVNQKTRVIVFANISNLLGYELDAQKISHQAKQKNSKVIIVCDATQLLPHKLIDVKTTNIDFLVASAHKMCGPTGVGMFYMKSIYFNKLIPLRLGGGMNNEVKHNHFTYANGYEKFEGGTPHTAGIIGWGAAIDYLNMIGWQHIHQHDIMLKQYVNKQFQTLPNVKLVNPHSIYPVVTFTVNGLHSQDVANYLGHQKIIVRSGLSCAKLAHYIIDEPAVVRASFWIYNKKQDVDKLVAALRKLKKQDILKYVI